MEWQQLLGFRHLARLGSFTKAGEATFRSQSALSQQVRALEGELGTLLVERIGKRRVALTPAGEKVLAFAETVLNQHDRLLAELASLKGLPQGRLRLAAPFTTLYHLLRRVLKEYSEKFPQVRLTVLDRPQAAIIDLVRRGEVDFGLTRESAAPKDLLVSRWLRLETRLMVPLGHPLVRKSRVTWQDIVRYPLIMPPPGPGPAGPLDIEARLKKEGLPYHVVMESSNVELSALYVEMGLGISFATLAGNLNLPGRRLVFLPLDRSFAGDHLVVVRRRDKRLPGYGEEFLARLFQSVEGPAHRDSPAGLGHHEP